MHSGLPISLAQLKAGNDQENIKSEIRELLCSMAQEIKQQSLNI